MSRRKITIAAALLALAAVSAATPPRTRLADAPLAPSAPKPVLGQTAFVTESDSGLELLARVDTGAATCSIHAEQITITAADTIERNVGKTIRFRITNRHGQSAWLERCVAEVREIRTTSGSELRYLVPLTIVCQGRERQVLVSLNDRSTMDYTMLLGRNLLAGEFLVDVERGS